MSSSYGDSLQAHRTVALGHNLGLRKCVLLYCVVVKTRAAHSYLLNRPDTLYLLSFSRFRLPLVKLLIVLPVAKEHNAEMI